MSWHLNLVLCCLKKMTMEEKLLSDMLVEGLMMLKGYIQQLILNASPLYGPSSIFENTLLEQDSKLSLTTLLLLVW